MLIMLKDFQLATASFQETRRALFHETARANGSVFNLTVATTWLLKSRLEPDMIAVETDSQEFNSRFQVKSVVLHQRRHSQLLGTQSDAQSLSWDRK